MEGAIRKWVRHNGITGVKWKGTNGEQSSSDEQLGMQEKRIAKWILHGKEAYPWHVAQGDKKIETHALHWNLSGLLYESVTRGWKDLGADKNSIRELQEKYAKTVITEMTKLIKARTRTVKDWEEKTHHLGHKHRLFASTKKGVGIYVGNEMTMKDGRMIELPTGEDVVDGMEGKRIKGKLYETNEGRWRMDQYRGVRMNKSKEKSVRGALTVGDIPRAMSKEEAKRVCSVMNEIRALIDKAHTTRKCDICRAKGKDDVEIMPSRDDEDLCKECRQRLTGREQANCCVECGTYEKEMHGEKCKYCWTSSLKKKTLDKRDSRTCGRCKGEMKKHTKKKNSLDTRYATNAQKASRAR